MDMETAVKQIIEPMGKTLADVHDVIVNHEQPTKLIILFTDSTWAEVYIKYPEQA